ncbi:MAG: hypothetical protein ACHQWU_05735 [Gemmatimonadales bacterium]
MHSQPKHPAARRIVMVSDVQWAADSNESDAPHRPIRPSLPAEVRMLDSARNARIRSRIMGGAYDSLEVVDAVARRLLDHGDL